MQKICESVIAPVVFNYVCRILTQATERRLGRLYFLARDGYLLHMAANVLVKKFNLPIECKYLYCSRNSLRLPTYHLIGEEAFELICVGDYKVTVNKIFDRVSLSQEKREDILSHAPMHDADRPLSGSELRQFAAYLKQNDVFRQEVMAASERAYPMAAGYLRQEGLLNEAEVAIVDSGWTGSMQRSLRQLLQAGGFTGQITGFYFGMYANPKERCDGTYLTWYFSAKGSTWDKIQFNENVFECMLSAPHAMTIGYKNENGRFVPEFAQGHEEEQQKLIEYQISEVMRSVSDMADGFEFSRFSPEQAHKDTQKRLNRFMTRPTKSEAEVYGAFLFASDIRDEHRLRLASREQMPLLKEYVIYRRILRKLGKLPPLIQELYWPCGVIAFLPAYKRTWYLWNILNYEWLRSVVLARIKRKSKTMIYNRIKKRLAKMSPLDRAEFYEGVCGKSRLSKIKSVLKLFLKKAHNGSRDVFIDYENKRTYGKEEFLQIAERFDTVSFDVFDTLVFRKTGTPTDVFKLIEAETGKAGFAKRRELAERHAREEKFKISGSYEVTIEEIYRSPQLRSDELIDDEIKKETDVCYANPFMHEIYKQLRKSNKRIIAISDMYLRKEQINKILTSCGYEHFDNIYVSSEYGISKSNGKLFIAAKSDNHGKLIHIGDNYIADVIMGKNKGIKTVYYSLSQRTHKV